MDFEWSDNQKALRKAVAALVGKDARGALEELERADPGRVRELVLDWQARLAAAGYLEPPVGPDGFDASKAFALLAAQEEVARASGSLFLCVETTARLFAGLVLGHGSESLARELEGPLRAGELIGGCVLTRTDDAVEAVHTGDGWVLHGTCPLVVNAPIADWLVVSAACEGKKLLCVVRAAADGVAVGPRSALLGLDGLVASPVTLDGARVPADHAIGPLDDLGSLAGLRSLEDQVLAVASVGLMHRAFAAAKDHARTRSIGGKPVFKRQEFAFKLSEMLTMTQTAQLMTWRAAWLLAEGDREGPIVMRCAKIFAAESAQEVAGLGLQVAGGEGYLRGGALERAWRESRFAPVAGTPSDQGRAAIADELFEKHRP
jgi:alkylation response protein AidB-like acyl-CoA dehydrogenase